MTPTRRTRAAGPALALVAGLALVLGLGAPAGADRPGPAYPPGEDVDGVVDGGRDHAPDRERHAAGGAPDELDGPDGSDGSDGPDEPDGASEEPGDDEAAVDDDATGDTGGSDDGGRGAGPYLVVLGTAVLLGGAVVAIARRL